MIQGSKRNKRSIRIEYGISQKERQTYGVPVAVGQVHSSDEGSESCQSEGTWLLQFYTGKTARKGMIRNECKRRKD